MGVTSQFARVGGTGATTTHNRITAQLTGASDGSFRLHKEALLSTN